MTELERWRGWAGCWSAPEGERLALLTVHASEDVAYRDPLDAVEGIVAISDYMGAFQRGFPGNRFEIDRVEAHHGRSLAHWRQLDAEGSTVMDGVSCATHGEDGRLRDVAGFFQAPAPEIPDTVA